MTVENAGIRAAAEAAKAEQATPRAQAPQADQGSTDEAQAGDAEAIRAAEAGEHAPEVEGDEPEAEAPDDHQESDEALAPDDETEDADGDDPDDGTEGTDDDPKPKKPDVRSLKRQIKAADRKREQAEAQARAAVNEIQVSNRLQDQLESKLSETESRVQAIEVERDFYRQALEQAGYQLSPEQQRILELEQQVRQGARPAQAQPTQQQPPTQQVTPELQQRLQRVATTLETKAKELGLGEPVQKEIAQYWFARRDTMTIQQAIDEVVEQKRKDLGVSATPKPRKKRKPPPHIGTSSESPNDHQQPGIWGAAEAAKAKNKPA